MLKLNRNNYYLATEIEKGLKYMSLFDFFRSQELVMDISCDFIDNHLIHSLT